MMDQDFPVDIVIPWVDGNDPDWLKERDFFLDNTKKDSIIDASKYRYRDSGTLKYVLRGIDQYMPWIRTIHFVTWGHLPVWLNPNATGLHIVKHCDFIPQEYLPTFSSHTIELNIHRIPGLSERFIYFNDDMLPLKKVQKKDFFPSGLPADFAVETSLTGRYIHSIADVLISNSSVINQNFSKRKVLKCHLGKWFHYRYGSSQLKTLLLLAWPRFSDFSNNHTANAFLKSTFNTVWEKEFSLLDEVCRHKFRVMSDVNQWLMRDWQLVSGQFMPKSTRLEQVFNMPNALPEIREALHRKKYQVICINDVSYNEPTDIESADKDLETLLCAAFPDKSRFER